MTKDGEERRTEERGTEDGGRRGCIYGRAYPEPNRPCWC